MLGGNRMNYNKNSTSRRLNHADSKKTKVKNKAVLIALKIFMVLFIIVGIIGASAVSGVARGIIDSAPDISNMDVAPTGFSTTVLSADGKEIATLVASGANRKYVTIDEIPVDLQHAFVAIEDSRFYEHNGIDFKGLLRAGYQFLKTAGDETQGASTITQQLARNVFLSHEVSIERKLKEMFLAMELEKKYTKQEILEFYLNNIFFANGYYGIQAACKG